MTPAQYAQVQKMIEDVESHGVGEVTLKMNEGRWCLFERTIKEKPTTQEPVVVDSVLIRMAL